MPGLKRALDTMKRDLKRISQRAQASMRDRAGEANRITIASRFNVVLARNIGQPGTIQAASSQQSTPIRQKAAGSDEDHGTTTGH